MSPSGGDASGSWIGSPATLLHNGVEIGTLPRGFTHEEFCLPGADVDVVNDEFKIVNGGDDGVSIFQEISVFICVEKFPLRKRNYIM